MFLFEENKQNNIVNSRNRDRATKMNREGRLNDSPENKSTETEFLIAEIWEIATQIQPAYSEITFLLSFRLRLTALCFPLTFRRI